MMVILVGLVVGGMVFVNNTQARKKAKIQVELLSKAIEEYKMDRGYYPESGNEADPIAYGPLLYQKLFYEGYEYSKNPNRADDPADPKSTKIYLTDLNPVISKQGWVDIAKTVPATSGLKDPWGNSYRYRSAKKISGAANGNAINPDFDLWSAGKNGKTNGLPNRDPMQDETNKDDIRNALESLAQQ